MTETKYDIAKTSLISFPKTWLITGVAGFIGSNILEALLKLNQSVVGIDNFLTGKASNLEEVKELVSEEQWKNFVFLEGDISNIDFCECVFSNFDFDYVLHHAAIVSSVRSVDDPILTNQININDFLNILVLARDSKVKRFIYASSCAVYGNYSKATKIEDIIGDFVSPYAITKYTNELYAKLFSELYGIETVGLRYFNVFGKRQSFGGIYSTVIPNWLIDMINGKDIYINGDEYLSRDFCYVEDCVQACILAAFTKEASERYVYNIGSGVETTLCNLFYTMKRIIEHTLENTIVPDVMYRELRSGDVKYFRANINLAKEFLGYVPEWSLFDGLEKSLDWYLDKEK